MKKPTIVFRLKIRKPLFLPLLVIIFMIVALPACKKDSSDLDPATAKGRFSEHTTCSITTPPAEVKLDGYYTKYLNCSGIAIVSNSDVPDEALYEIDKLYSFLLKDLDNVKAQLISEGCYHALANEAGLAFNALPEVSISQENYGGQYIYDIPMAYTDADNLLCRPGNKSVGTNSSLHEIAHMIHLTGLHLIYKGFDAELTNAYNNAKQQGLWANTYGIQNEREYLAVGVTVWYGVHRAGPAGGDGYSNDIYSRKLLQVYDPTLYGLISKYFNHSSDVPGCLEPVVDENVVCVPTVTDIDGNVYNVVSIGSQCWMAENLRTTRFNDGTPIHHTTNVSNWSEGWHNQTIPAWINYNHDTANDAIYGKLYNHYAAKNPKLCPQGWHMPTEAELTLLIKQTSSQIIVMHFVL